MDTTLQGGSLDNSCRCCCSNNLENNQIYSLFLYDSNIEMDMAKVITNLTAINIYKNDGLSQIICELCKEQAINAYKFQQMCVSNDDCLRMSRKPFMNNEHDYSLYMNDDYDMDLSEYLIGENDSVDHEENDSKKEQHEEQMQIDRIEETELDSFECNDNNLSSQQIDNTKNYDFSMSQKRKNLPYKCKVCLKNWPTPSKLKRHMKVHASKKDIEMIEKEKLEAFKKDPEVQCPICFVALDSQEKLHDHMESHKTDKRLTICEEITAHKSELGIFYCKICEAEFLSPKKLQNHMNTQHMRKVSVIAKPNQKIVSYSDKMKAKNTQKDRICLVCGKKFDCPSKLERHKPVHDKIRKPSKRKPTPKRHQCQLCEKKFETPSKLSRHQLVHSKAQPVINESMKIQILEVLKS